MERAPGSATLEDVRAHDAVLQSVVDAGATAVAVRFGQSFDNDAHTCAHVDERGERALAVLREYEGCIEMRLLLAEEVQAAEPTAMSQSEAVGPGRAYLEHARAERDRIEGLALRGALGPVVRAERVQVLPRGRGVAFAHLVRREDIDSYHEAVAALPALADAVVVGPLALYSFAEPA